MFEDRSKNRKLSDYLASKSEGFETASFGETTSGDEMVVAESSTGGNVQIFRETETSKNFEMAKIRAELIENYEKSVVSKYE